MEIIGIENLSKTYIVSKNPVKRLDGAIFRRGGERFFALRDVSLSIKKGEAVGIIGRNGSGKSTLLKILAGITEPNSGRADVRGSVSAILELGAGFNPEYSGIRNIYLNGAVFGIDKSVIANRIDDILKFAEIGADFARLPVKTYSSGMLARLAFASAILLDTDIILVDEVLAVGDIRFRAKCFKKFEELKAEGRTILFVSHDADAVRRFCGRAVWLSGGRIAADGGVDVVTSKYIESCVARGDENAAADDALNRYGSHIGCIGSIRLSATEFAFGEKITAEVRADIPDCADIEVCGVCLSVKDVFGLDLCVFRTEGGLRRGVNIVKFEFDNRFNSGEYMISVGVENRAYTPISYYEYIEGAARFESYPPSECRIETFGVTVLPCKIDITQ